MIAQTILLGVLLSVAALSASAIAEPLPAEAAGTKAVELALENVRCASCSLRVRKLLGRVDGVAGVREGASKERVVVEYAPAKVTVAVLTKTLEDAGFPARVVAP